MTTGFIEVELGPGLARMDRPIVAQLESAHSEASRIIAESYRSNAPEASGAFREGIAMVNAIYGSEGRVVDIESDQYRDPVIAARRPEGIGDLIERGFRYRLRKKAGRVGGKFPAKRAIAESEPRVNETLDTHVRAAIRIIEFT